MSIVLCAPNKLLNFLLIVSVGGGDDDDGIWAGFEHLIGARHFGKCFNYAV
jgi:hypothetical protein